MQLKNIMLAGTGSDVGKSVLATALCRIFLQDGYRPAPFKAQNMALNSYATPDGREIGRAQAVQAEAAGLPPSTDMNPLLLKPSSDHTSQVVLHGRPIGNRNAYEYFRRQGRDELRAEVSTAFDRLAAQYNPIVMEGAGSIAEINLRDTDLVNMPMARHADARVVLVADIDRGGVFASCYGSIMLQAPEDRPRIAGILINKFRGDMRLFDEGRRMMEEVCGVPVLGVIPFLEDVHIEEEDSVDLAGKATEAYRNGRKVNIAVVKLRHLSNFTDFFSLEQDPRIHLYYTREKEALQQADIIVVPGSKSTIDDLRLLHADGTAEAILRARRRGATVIGICGGYQMMGREVLDPDGLEGDCRCMNGLGLLPVRTVLTADKVTRQVTFRFDGEEGRGYEIHMGRTEALETPSPTCHITDPEPAPDGYLVDEHCFGTYIHGILDNAPVVDRLVRRFLPTEGGAAESTFDYRAFKEQQYDLLAAHVRQYVDMEKLYEILKQ